MITNFFKNNKIHKSIVPFFDIFFLLRPVLFFIIWVIICIGMYLSTFSPVPFLRETELFISEINLKTIIFFFSMTTLTGSIFIINQIVDKECDKINKKSFLIDNYITVAFANKVGIILLISSLIILLFINWIIFIIGILMYLISGYLYNMEPYEFRKRPLMSVLCNAVLSFLLLYAGFIYAMNLKLSSIDLILNFQVIKYFLPYILSFIAVFLLIDFPDIKGDKECNRKTFILCYGKKQTVLLSTVLIFIALFYSLKISDPLLSTSSVVSAPFFLYAIFRGFNKDILRAIRYPIAIINLFVMIIFPYLFIGILFVFYFSKYYYWHRFSLHYPTILVDD